jgi:hypothetical protein
VHDVPEAAALRERRMRGITVGMQTTLVQGEIFTWFATSHSEDFKVQLVYNITDFLTIAVTGFFSGALTKNLYGGYATGNVPGDNLSVPNCARPAW